MNGNIYGYLYINVYKNPNKKLGDIIYILNLCDPYKLIEAIGDILDEKAILLEKVDVKLRKIKDKL